MVVGGRITWCSHGQVKVGRSSCAGSVLLHFQQTNSLVNDNLLFTDPGKNNKIRPLIKLAILLSMPRPLKGVAKYKLRMRIYSNIYGMRVSVAAKLLGRHLRSNG